MFKSINIITDATGVRVQAYSLYEYLLALQEAIQAGYKIDFETNQGYPQQIGTVFTAGLKLAGASEPVEVDQGIDSIEEAPVEASDGLNKLTKVHKTRRAKASAS